MRWTDQDAATQAAAYEGAMTDVPASEYRWTYVPAFPTARIGVVDYDADADRGEAWIGWMEWLGSEDAERRLDGLFPVLGPDGLEGWWLSDPTVEPLIIVWEDPHDWPYLWDGHHRLAIAKLNELTAVPVFLGRRKGVDFGDARTKHRLLRM